MSSVTKKRQPNDGQKSFQIFDSFETIRWKCIRHFLQTESIASTKASVKLWVFIRGKTEEQRRMQAQRGNLLQDIDVRHLKGVDNPITARYQVFFHDSTARKKQCPATPPPTYLFVCEKMKNALPLGIGLLLFLTLISDRRRGRALTGSIFSSVSSSSSSSSSGLPYFSNSEKDHESVDLIGFQGGVCENETCGDGFLFLCIERANREIKWGFCFVDEWGKPGVRGEEREKMFN